MHSIDEGSRIVVTDEDARSGVTGHHVRHVLAFGMAGIVAAFAAVGIYFGYDRLIETLSNTDPVALAVSLTPYLLAAALAAAVALLVFSTWTRLSGETANATQTGMRLRVSAQFAIVLALMGMLYWSTA